MMRGMAAGTPAARLTESLPGRVAGWLLAALWIFSMSAVDAHAFSSFPVCVVLAVVLLLGGGAILAGKRLVRMSLTGWVSLAVGGYFLGRCWMSYAVVDSWCESALIMGAVVYYLAGVYAAQNRSYNSLLLILGVALLLNIAAFYVVRQPEFCLEWTGRHRYTPAGENHTPCTLFVYKNVAGVFLSLGGSVLVAAALWLQRGVERILLLLLAAAAVGVSFLCGTRAVYLVLPLAVAMFWGLNLLLRLYSGKKAGGGTMLLGLGVLVLGGIAVYDLLFGSYLVSAVSGADSHIRYLIWSSACEVLPHVPLWGCGANCAQWEMVPFYNEWQHPNFVHNEYLQAWIDYGLIGVLLVVGVLLLHLVRGLRCLVSECEAQSRRRLAGLCMVVLLVVAVYAVADFPWHVFAVVALCAFVCGVLASPFNYRREPLLGRGKWAPGQAPLVQVRAQKWPGRLLLLVVTAGLLCADVALGIRLYPAWSSVSEYDTLSRPGNDPTGDARREFIARLLPAYPSPALMDVYMMLPPPRYADFARRESLLRLAHQHNPRQLFTVAMLVDTLGALGKYEEAEQLMRKSYVGDAMPGSLLSNWPAYYAYNLLLRGRHELLQGHKESALSMLSYGLRMHEQSRIHFNVMYRQGIQPWRQHGGIKPRMGQFIQSCEADVRLLRLIGTAPDDSWQAPAEPGGRPALYRSLVEKVAR